jgi:hypothetical protein
MKTVYLLSKETGELIEEYKYVKSFDETYVLYLNEGKYPGKRYASNDTYFTDNYGKTDENLIEPIKESDELSDEEVEQIIQENRG